MIVSQRPRARDRRLSQPVPGSLPGGLRQKVEAAQFGAAQPVVHGIELVVVEGKKADG